MVSPRRDDALLLQGRRRLAYAEYGETDGTPILVFHGLPGSRLSWGYMPDDPFPPGLRVIAPDRPGYGNSDPRPGRTHLDWVDDITALADALDLQRFAVLGVSGGGPGALACAWRLSDRLTSAGVVAGPAPTNAPGVFEGMSRTNRFFMKLAWRLPGLSTLNTRIVGAIVRRNPARYINTLKYKVDDVDRAILTRPGIREMLVRDFAEALRGGAQGMVDDMAANHGRPWGFPLDRIRLQVRFWYGDLDRSVPPAMGRYLSNTVPDSVVTFVPDAGHLWILVHLSEVLVALTGGQSDARKRKAPP